MMSKNQRIHFMAELWPNACAAQGWNKSDAAKRYTLFEQVLTAEKHPNRAKHLETIAKGQNISFNDFDNVDFDAVKKECLHLTDNINIRDGEKARLLWAINNVLYPQLRVYRPNLESYLERLLKERFKRFPGINTIEDLSTEKKDGKPSQLDQYRMTLAGRIQYLRKEAGDSVHDLNIKAGTKCTCAEICRPRIRTTPKVDAAGASEASISDNDIPEDAELPQETENSPF